MAHEDREERPFRDGVELRVAGSKSAPVITGYAAMFEAETVIGSGLFAFREKVAPGAFDAALSRKDDVRALFNHDTNVLLGRTSSGTLRLAVDEKGLRYTIDVNPDDPMALAVVSQIRRGDIDGSSFGFRIEDDLWDETPVKRGELPIRTIRSVELFDVSPVTFPAYPQTSVTARSRAHALLERGGNMDARVRARIAVEQAKAWP